LRYLITQYYRNNKLPALQFLNFATESDLEHLDELIYLYIKTGKKYYYKAAKEFYIYILERFIVRFSKGKQPVQFYYYEYHMFKKSITKKIP